MRLETNYGGAMISGGHALTVKLSAGGTGTEVFLDGVAIKGLVNLELAHKAGDVSRLRLELFPSSVDITGFSGVAETTACDEATAKVVIDDQVRTRALEVFADIKARREASAATE